MCRVHDTACACVRVCVCVCVCTQFTNTPLPCLLMCAIYEHSAAELQTWSSGPSAIFVARWWLGRTHRLALAGAFSAWTRRVSVSVQCRCRLAGLIGLIGWHWQGRSLPGRTCTTTCRSRSRFRRAEKVAGGTEKVAFVVRPLLLPHVDIVLLLAHVDNSRPLSCCAVAIRYRVPGKANGEQIHPRLHSELDHGAQNSDPLAVPGTQCVPGTANGAQSSL